jgi:hypothetical protein
MNNWKEVWSRFVARGKVEPPPQPQQTRFTVSDLADPARLAAWLAYDGNPLTVEVETAESRRRWGCGNSRKTETKLVQDAETAKEWWSQYRAGLMSDWVKVSPFRNKGWRSFLGDCARALGFKTGKQDEKIAAARAALREQKYYPPNEDNGGNPGGL